MRAFIAVELAKNARERIIALQQAMALLKVKLVEPQNLHLTIKFLGTITEEEAQSIAKKLSAIRIRAFKITLSTAGAFPSEQNPRVIWMGSETNDELMALKKIIDEALPGYKDTHASHKSHVTLARYKDTIANPQGALEAIENIKKELNKIPIELEVSEVKLYKSTLTQTGPVYEQIRC